MDIKLVIIDVDGTLTDASIYYGDNNIEIKAFNVKDGAILKPLRDFGIAVLFLTGRKCEAVSRRAIDLGVDVVQGISNKEEKLKELVMKLNLDLEQIAYIGDDLNDYAAMKVCGYKACPSDAAEEIKAIADYVSYFSGGHGAVRDIIEVLLKRLEKYDSFLMHYGVDMCI